MSALQLPKNIKVKGLCIFCSKCKRKVSNQCGNTKKSMDTCENTHLQKYKVYIHVPGTKGVKTKILETRNPMDAVEEALNFRKAMEEYNYSSKIYAANTSIPKTIMEGMAFYLCYLNNETPFEQEHKQRSVAHKKEVERYFFIFADYLKTQGLQAESLPIEKLNRDVVGKLKSYLLETKDYSPKTYNKYIGLMRICLSYLIEEFDLRMKNPFKGFKPLATEARIETITNEEFHALLKIITPKNSTQILNKGKQQNHNDDNTGAQTDENEKKKKSTQNKNRYKPWLKDAFLLALLTGRRREEFVCLKFNGIKANKYGVPVSIKISDFKVNRSKGVSKKEAGKWIYIPVIAPLKKLLYDMGYEEHKGKDMYILAPNESMTRKSIMDFVSKSFTFYYKQLNTGRDLSLYDLRKTYISHLYANHGSDARLISGHGGEAVMRQHYIDESVLAEVAKSFEMFGL